MYNLYNLNDYEFELLCKDIMEIKLDCSLYTFPKGPDGGIDICDFPSLICINIISCLSISSITLLHPTFSYGLFIPQGGPFFNCYDGGILVYHRHPML
jgi:hypothetical protein